VTRPASLHLALSKMLADGTSQIDVVDDHGTPIGSVRLEAITQLIAPVRPGPGESVSPAAPADRP
jgi:hypothetical protein